MYTFGVKFMVFELYFNKAVTLKRALGHKDIVVKIKFSQSLKIQG